MVAEDLGDGEGGEKGSPKRNLEVGHPSLQTDWGREASVRNAERS